MSAFTRMFARKNRPLTNTPPTGRVALTLEVLETREVPAGLQAYVTGTTLVVNGTDAADTITVREVNGRLSVDGATIGVGSPATWVASVATTAVKALKIGGGSGNDVIDLSRVASMIPATINGGAGDDNLTGTSAPDVLSGGSGVNRIHGRVGTDEVYNDFTGTDTLVVDAADRLTNPFTRHLAANPAARTALGAATTGVVVEGDKVTRTQTFAGGKLFWSPTTGTTALTGAFYTEYVSLAGAKDHYGTPVQKVIGLPLTESLPGAGGSRYVSFQNGRIYSSAAGAHVVYGSIGATYAGAGNLRDAQGRPVSEVLGAPTSDELAAPNGGRVGRFQGGEIYWTPQTGAHPVYGPVLAKLKALGGVGGTVGYPTSAEDDLGVLSSRVQQFQGAWIMSSAVGTREVSGAILSAYRDQGLWFVAGRPTGDGHAVPGGRAQRFERGTLFSSPVQGVHEVHGNILAKYNATGGPGGMLGMPTSNELRVADGVGRYNHFENGSIYWSPTTGARLVYGAIRDKWVALGAAGSLLGYPTGDEYAVHGGRAQEFERGTIYWSAATGAREVHGAILSRYAGMVGPASFLGMPTTDEMVAPDGVGRYTHFQNGSIYWTPTTGAQVVYGAIRDKWASLGWERGLLGYATSDEYAVRGGRAQNFQGGVVYWSASTGAHEVHGAILQFYLAAGGPDSKYGLPITDEQRIDGVNPVGDFQSYRWTTFQNWLPGLSMHYEIAWASLAGHAFEA